MMKSPKPDFVNDKYDELMRQQERRGWVKIGIVTAVVVAYALGLAAVFHFTGGQ